MLLSTTKLSESHSFVHCPVVDKQKLLHQVIQQQDYPKAPNPT